MRQPIDPQAEVEPVLADIDALDQQLEDACFLGRDDLRRRQPSHRAGIPPLLQHGLG